MSPSKKEKEKMIWERIEEKCDLFQREKHDEESCLDHASLPLSKQKILQHVC